VRSLLVPALALWVVGCDGSADPSSTTTERQEPGHPSSSRALPAEDGGPFREMPSGDDDGAEPPHREPTRDAGSAADAKDAGTGTDEGSGTDPADDTVGPGHRCRCDADCGDLAGLRGMCIRGICGLRATRPGCPAGSQEGCPDGFRCWSGTGIALCYPDYAAGDCDGVRDHDGSCVAASTACDPACTVICR